ncbi:hypothetical protein ACTXT7_013841 [Hymenolepis weldensis]
MKQLEQREIMQHRKQHGFLKLMEQFTKHLNLNPGQLENFAPKLCPYNLVLQIDESRKMDAIVLDDTAMIQQNACQQVYVRRIAQPSRKNRQKNISDKKFTSPHWICGKVPHCRDCPYTFNVNGKEGTQEAEVLSRVKDHLKEKKIAGKPTGSFHFLSLVSLTHEERSSNRLQFAVLIVNDKKVKLQLDTVSDITLISKNI